MMGAIIMTLLSSGTLLGPDEQIRPRPPIPKRVAALLADTRFQPFLQGDRVEALPVEDLLATLKPGEAVSDLGLAAKFRVVPLPRRVPDGARAKLRRILIDPRTYEDAVSGCAFAPSAAFRFWMRDAFIDVLLGNECHQVAFAAGGTELLEYFVATEVAARAIGALAREVLEKR
jgi:hypothetical protein